MPVAWCYGRSFLNNRHSDSWPACMTRSESAAVVVESIRRCAEVRGMGLEVARKPLFWAVEWNLCFRVADNTSSDIQIKKNAVALRF